MAKTYPPDNWDVDAGTWGTDIDEDDTINFGVSGGSVINFIDTTPESDAQISSTGFFPLYGDKLPLRVDAWVRADRKNAGDDVAVLINEFKGNQKISTLTQEAVYNSPVVTINTWERKVHRYIPASDRRWAKIALSKANVAFNAYVDSVEARFVAPSISGYRGTSVQSINSGSWTTIVYNNTDSDTNGGIDFDTGTGIATITTPGTYLLQARGLLSFINGGDIAAIRYEKNSAAAKNGERVLAANSFQASPCLSVTDWLDEGDTVEFALFHNKGSAVNLSIGAEETYFSITMLDF